MLTASMEEEDGSTSLSSFISVGKAEVQSMLPVKSREDNIHALPDPQSQPTTATLAELIDMHRLPPIPSPQPSPRPSEKVYRQRDRCNEQENRRSIIAPSSVKINFVGTLSDTPVGLPLERGLQKLYRLYQENDPAPSPLPREVQITDVPLTTIAESLESHIIEIKIALDDCATNIENLNQVNQQTRSEMVNLEYQYCLARQEANLCSMSADDFRLRLEWQREEIARVNAEKEAAMAANIAYAKDQIQLRKEMLEMLEVKNENVKLRQMNRMHEERHKDLLVQLEGAKKCLDKAQYALRTVPAPIQKFCSKVLVPQSVKGTELLIENWDTDKENESPDTTDPEKEQTQVQARVRPQSMRQYY